MISNIWIKPSSMLPQIGQIVFIYIGDSSHRALHIAQCVSTGKDELQNEILCFYAYQPNKYIHISEVLYWLSVKLPNPPNEQQETDN
jgi:hypothetical protein